MNQHSAISAMYSIVVGVDYSEVGASALSQAVNLAKSHDHGHIHVVHAGLGRPWLEQEMPDPVASPGALHLVEAEPAAADLLRETRAYVEKVLTKLGVGETTSNLSWTIHFRNTEPAAAIAQLAADVGADMVVVGTHSRHGIERFLLGSVAEKVVRLAPCPVLVVRPVGAVADVDSPKIEPLCPDCSKARAETAGKSLWCERHAERHARAHTYHFAPFRDSHQSGLL